MKRICTLVQDFQVKTKCDKIKNQQKAGMGYFPRNRNAFLFLGKKTIPAFCWFLILSH